MEETQETSGQTWTEILTGEDTSENASEDPNTGENTGETTGEGRAEEKVEEGSMPETLTIKVNGKEESFSLKDQAQVKKLIEYTQKGRYNETIHESKKALEEQQNLIARETEKMSYAYLMNVSNGKIQLELPKRSDYFDKGGKYFHQFEEDEAAETAYKNALDSYDSTISALKEYQANAKRAYSEYEKTIDGFKKDYPDLDVQRFMSESVNPLIKPLFSMGAEPLNRELLDAIYFYSYKDEIIKKAIEEDRKKLSKPQKRQSASVRVETSNQPKVWGGDAKVQGIKFR